MTTIYINNDNLKLFKVIFIFHTIMSLFENIRDGKEEAVIIYYYQSIKGLVEVVIG
jgi:hypothetical protein